MAALLTIGVGVVSTLAVQAQAKLDKDVAAQQNQAALDAKDTVIPGAFIRPRLDLTGLRTKREIVKDADRAVDIAIADWGKGGVKFSVIVEAVDSCFSAANDFDVNAAPFSVNELTGLPPAIDQSDTAMDCGRSSLGNISGKLA
jgi:hypothetical protein